MREQFHFLILFVLFSTFCFGQENLPGECRVLAISDRKSKEIDTLALVDPIVFIIENDKKGNDSLQAIARENLIKGIDKIIPLRIAIFDLDIDSVYLKHYKRTILDIMSQVEEKKSADADTLAQNFISIMNGLHVNYIIGVAQLGNTILKTSTIGCVIFDRQKKNIAFYGKSHYEQVNPCDMKTVDEQLMKIFKKYF